MKKLKIVHIIQHLGTGGAEKMVVDLAKQSSKSHDVSIICLYPKRDNQYEKLLQNDQLKVVFLNKKHGLDMQTFIALWKQLVNIKPDVVHTHMHAAIYTVPWAIFHRKNARIHTVHSIATMEIEKIHRIIQRCAYHFLGVVPVAISDLVKQSILEEYKLKSEQVPIIYNGIDTTNFKPIANKENDVFTIINVASFSKWKNQTLLIDAFKILTDQGHRMKLVFVGDGPERENVERKVKEFQLEQSVRFVGISPDVNYWLSQSDLFVLCSTFEGLPLSIIEAMSSGLPIVATDVGGIADIVENGINGFLVPSNDAINLANAILKIARDKQLQTKMSNNNITQAKRFDIASIHSQYLKLYTEKLGEQHVL